MSRIDSFMNLSPLKTTVSRKVVPFSDISSMNFIHIRKSKDRPHGLPMWFLWLRVIIKAFNCSFALTSLSFRQSGAFTHIVVATVAVATTGPAVSTLHASLFSCC